MVLRFSICCQFLRAVEQHVVPVRRVEIFNRLQFEAVGVDFLFDGGEFLERPELVRIAGQAPAGVVADGLVAGLVAARRAEIIHEMDDQMRAAALLREAVMLRVELVAIKSKAEFHFCHDWANGNGLQSRFSPSRLRKRWSRSASNRTIRSRSIIADGQNQHAAGRSFTVPTTSST